MQSGGQRMFRGKGRGRTQLSITEQGRVGYRVAADTHTQQYLVAVTEVLMPMKLIVMVFTKLIQGPLQPTEFFN